MHLCVARVESEGGVGGSSPLAPWQSPSLGEEGPWGAHGHPQPFLPAASHAARVPAMARPLVSPRPGLCAYDCLCGSGEGWEPLPSLLALAHTLLHAHTRVRARARSQWAAALHNASPFTPSLAIPAPREQTGKGESSRFFPRATPVIPVVFRRCS